MNFGQTLILPVQIILGLPVAQASIDCYLPGFLSTVCHEIYSTFEIARENKDVAQNRHKQIYDKTSKAGESIPELELWFGFTLQLEKGIH